MKRGLIPFFRAGSMALLVAALVCSGTAKAHGQFGSVPGIGPTAPPYYSPPSTRLPAAPFHITPNFGPPSLGPTRVPSYQTPSTYLPPRVTAPRYSAPARSTWNYGATPGSGAYRRGPTTYTTRGGILGWRRRTPR